MSRKVPNTEREKPRGAAAGQRKLAQKIAGRVFADGVGARAHRLKLYDVDDRYMAGWCFDALVDQIEDVLRAER